MGEGVTHPRLAERLPAWQYAFGTTPLAPAALCMPLPDGFSHVDAAAFIMIYATSQTTRWWDRAQLKAGETVLVCWALLAGTAAIQIAKAMAHADRCGPATKMCVRHPSGPTRPSTTARTTCARPSRP